MSVAFQMRPVMIVPASRRASRCWSASTTAPRRETIIGARRRADRRHPVDGRRRLDRVEPRALRGRRHARRCSATTLHGARHGSRARRRGADDRRAAGRSAASSPPKAAPARRSPPAPRCRPARCRLVVRRRLSPTRTRSSNLLAARLLPTVTSAALVGGDLQLHGLLLGDDTDDVIVALLPRSDGATVRLFDAVDDRRRPADAHGRRRRGRRAGRQLPRDPARQQPAGEGQSERGGAMTTRTLARRCRDAGCVPARRARPRRARAVLAAPGHAAAAARGLLVVARARPAGVRPNAAAAALPPPVGSRARRARSGALRARQARLLRRRRHRAPPERAHRRRRPTAPRRRPRGSSAGSRSELQLQPVECFVLARGAAAQRRQRGRPGDRGCLNDPSRTRADAGAGAAAVGRARRAAALLRSGHALFRHGLLALASGRRAGMAAARTCRPLVARELLFAGDALPAALGQS